MEHDRGGRRGIGRHAAALERRLWPGTADGTAPAGAEPDEYAAVLRDDGGAWWQLRVTRTAAVMYGAAGVLGFVLLALPHGADFRPLGVAVPSAIALAYAPFLFAGGDRLPMVVHHVGTALGIALISVAAYATGPLSTTIAFLYVWAGTFGFLFFSRAVAFLYIAAIACAYGVVVATAPRNDAALARWLFVTIGVSVTGVVVSSLIDQIRRLAASERRTAAEKSRLAEAAERQKEYFRSLLENSPTAIAAMDLDDRVVAWNPAAERLFGYTVEEAIGRPIDDLVARSEELRGTAAAGTRRARAGDEVHLVTQRTRKDGTLVDVELLIAPVRLAGAVGYFAIYHDIGELLRARREAEAANRAKGAFLATMSHEIRTPMNGVIGMTGLLLDTELDREQREYAEVIRLSGDALLEIINDILDFSKIEAGKLDLERAAIDVRECVEAALDVVATRAAEKELELAYELDATVPRAIFGDAVRFRQILINLLGNAVKFTEAGEVVVTIGAMPDGRDHVLEFAVRDTGVGIPPDRVDSLFESFSQLDPSTSRHYGGTGLGLTISKRLAELMGGSMSVESEPGVGSTFRFTIAAEAAPPVLHPFDEAADRRLASRRLLVVDDSATNRRILVGYAQSWGMQVQATGSPEEALAWLRAGRQFDVALLDRHMPALGGVALAGEIRRECAARGLPLVLLTPLGQRDAGADFAATLTKPIKPSQLYNTLLAVLNGAAEPAPGAAAEPDARSRPAVRILLAEDNEVNRKLAIALLARMGYQADVARDGLEALAALQHRAYDVVLMDVEMPELDGFETARRIRSELPADRQPHIIAMTANAMEGDREQCLAAGMDDYVSKPVRPEALAAAVAAGIAGRAPASPPSGDAMVLDGAALERLHAVGGDAFVRELIDIFATETPQLLAAISAGVAAGDAQAVRRSAHTLKSNATTFGATALGKVARDLETRAASGTLDGAAELVERLVRECELGRAALETARAATD